MLMAKFHIKPLTTTIPTEIDENVE
jgi:hypothetical protein